jgi:hypothetical protein
VKNFFGSINGNVNGCGSCRIGASRSLNSEMSSPGAHYFRSKPSCARIAVRLSVMCGLKVTSIKVNNAHWHRAY